MKRLTLTLAAVLMIAGCGGTAKDATTATQSPRASASASPALTGCADAVRIIAEIKLNPERLGANDGRQVANWAGEWAAKVMSADLGKQQTQVVSELWSGLTSIAIAFPEATPKAVEDNRPKIYAAAEAIVTICARR